MEPPCSRLHEAVKENRSELERIQSLLHNKSSMLLRFGAFHCLVPPSIRGAAAASLESRSICCCCAPSQPRCVCTQAAAGRRRHGWRTAKEDSSRASRCAQDYKNSPLSLRRQSTYNCSHLLVHLLSAVKVDPISPILTVHLPVIDFTEELSTHLPMRRAHTATAAADHAPTAIRAAEPIGLFDGRIAGPACVRM